MEIKPSSTPNHPDPTMLNKVAKLLPLLALVIATPSFAAGNYSSHNHSHGQIAAGETGKHLDNLNLTPEQKTKVEALRAATKTQLDAVLTPEQRQKHAQIEAQHQANKQDGNGLNLTVEQKAKIKTIRDANKEQFKAILTPAQQAQMAQGGGGWGKDGGNKLNLTADQKAKMEQLRASTKTQMEAVLTPAQQQQAKAHQDRRQAMGNTWKSLNLTPDQQAKIKTIRESSEQQLNAILTPEQQAKHKSRKHGGWHKNG
jgi:Spy/CpxP family protein refolding chaperone